MIKLLIGGSPCTYWSVAQKKGREVEAKGLGWELFKNYLIAKEKFKPDLFLYENNKSAAQPIKDQISRELGVDLMYINSALVSAQNRQRFYAFNWCVDQPADRGIMLKDILESGFPFGDMIGKSFCLTSNYCKGSTAYQTLEHHKRTLAAEAIPLGMTQDGKSQCVRASCYKDGIRNLVWNNVDRRTCVAHPVRVGSMPNEDGEITGGQAHRIYDASGKAVALCARANGGGPETGLYAYPAEEAQGMAWRGRGDGSAYEAREDGKANALTASGHQSRLVVTTANGKEMPVYEVINGEIEIKGKKYPIKLPDGFYIIRKLTPVECERLQTLPDGYTSAVSATQRYRGLGNGWTAEVIIHILMGALKDVPRDEEIVVLSMYDGIGTGRYCLDKMGFTNVTYYIKPLGLRLNNKTQIFPLKNGIDFLGFHTYLTSTGKVVRKVRAKSINNMKRKIRKYRGLVDSGRMTLESVLQSYASWCGHISHGNTYHLRQNMDAYFFGYFPELRPTPKGENTHGPKTEQPRKQVEGEVRHHSRQADRLARG